MPGYTADRWKSLNQATVDEWVTRILQLLKDGTPRTFNRLVLELTGYEYTADVALGNNPDDALWLAVQRHEIEYTLVAPIRFRKVGVQ